MPGFRLGPLPMNGTITENSEGRQALEEGNWISGASFFGDF